MRKGYIGILVVAVVTIVGVLKLVNLGEGERDKYPYTGISVMTSDASLMDIQKVNDIELKSLISSKDMAIEGEFTGNPELTEVAIWPEEGTNEYLVTESLAKEFGKTFEEMVPKQEYYKLDFSPINVMYNALSEKETERVSVYVAKEEWEMFPDPSKYQHAVLFADEFVYGGDNAVVTSTIGYYYVSDENEVYSAEKFKGLDIYSGESVKELFEEIDVNWKRISE